MKKFLFTLAAAVITLTASAQVYLGGEVGLWRDYDGNETTFKILPEVGYNLSDKWAIGTVIGYSYGYENSLHKNLTEITTNAFVVTPYARYTYATLGPVNLFLDGGFGFATYKTETAGKDGDAQNAWEIGIKPGVAVNLTEKLSFVSHVGFLGWRDQDEAEVFGDNGVGFDLSGNTITFGLYYNF